MYCQDVTPGAFSMKRRALVMRKLACWQHERCSLDALSTEDQALRLPFLCTFTLPTWLADSEIRLQSHAHLGLTLRLPHFLPCSPAPRGPASRTRTTGMA